LPEILKEALNHAIEKLASLDGCGLVDTAVREINKVLDKYAKVTIYPSGCSVGELNLAINSGREETLIENEAVNIYHLTSVGIELKIHDLKFDCSNMKKLIEDFKDGVLQLGSLFEDVLVNNDAIKAIKAFLDDAKQLISNFNLDNLNPFNAELLAGGDAHGNSSYAQDEAVLIAMQKHHVELVVKRAMERHETAKYGKPIKDFQHHELIRIGEHVVPKVSIDLEAITKSVVQGHTAT
jgi:hypothetical protein